jgi:hypothetical protein
MFSDNLYADIATVTQRALEQINNVRVIDRVTIVRGYVQLSLSNRSVGDARLRNSLERLTELAREEKRMSLVAELDRLVQAVDRESAPGVLAAHA